MSTVDYSPIVGWLIGLLETGTGKQIGDGRTPDDQVAYPYGVLHVIDGSQFAGPPLFSPDADVDIPIQVDSVGRRVDQCRWMADRVRRTLLARDGGAFQVNPDHPAGYKIADRQNDGGPSVAIPEGNSANRLYTIPERYLIRVTTGVTP